MPAAFGVHFLPCMKNVPKRTKMHLNEVSLTNTEIRKSPIQSWQLSISWKMKKKDNKQCLLDTPGRVPVIKDSYQNTKCQ